METLIKTKEELEILREGGRRLARIVSKLQEMAVSGLDSRKINQEAISLAKKEGGEPSFLGYQPIGSKRPYPAAVCVSVNEEIVHGVPNENPFVLKAGDIVSIDMGLRYKGLYTDHAVTVGVGSISYDSRNLIAATEEALRIGIEATVSGGTTGDIGYAVEAYAREVGFTIVRDLAGHGVGREIHELPLIPNYGKRGKGEEILTGMVLAIEPMLALGSGSIVLEDDGYTISTSDRKRSAHFEHTIVVTENGPEILTVE